MDNQVSSFSYDNLLIPRWCTWTRIPARHSGKMDLPLFGGGQIPEEQKKITVEQEIVSIFHDASHIGLVLENGQGSSGFILELYGKDGELLFQKELDYGYQGIEIQSGQILLYNRTGFCVYSQAGVEKFRGELNGVMIQQMSRGSDGAGFCWLRKRVSTDPAEMMGKKKRGRSLKRPFLFFPDRAGGLPVRLKELLPAVPTPGCNR